MVKYRLLSVHCMPRSMADTYTTSNSLRSLLTGGTAALFANGKTDSQRANVGSGEAGICVAEPKTHLHVMQELKTEDPGQKPDRGQFNWDWPKQ